VIEPVTDDFIDGLQPIASELGVAFVRELVRHFGGTRVYVPRAWREGLPLNVLGDEQVRKLCTMFGPERIDIPLVPWTGAAIVRFASQLEAAGHNVGEIAREIGVSHRRIQRWRKSGGVIAGPRRRRAHDERQIDLVDWLNHG
jgi:hypothetical protein